VKLRARTALARARQTFAPPLAHHEVHMLRACPYDDAGAYSTPIGIQTGNRLVSLGLMEKDPTSFTYRRTEEGDEVVKLYQLAGWI
jgi:hypothetical protein